MEIKEKIWSRNEEMAYLFLDYSIALANNDFCHGVNIDALAICKRRSSNDRPDYILYFNTRAANLCYLRTMHYGRNMRIIRISTDTVTNSWIKQSRRITINPQLMYTTGR